MSGRRTTATAAALLLGALPLAACSGGGSVGSGGGTFVEALDELPRPSGDRRQQLYVTWADLDAVREANGEDDVFGVGDDAVVSAPVGAFEERGATLDADFGFSLADSEVIASVRAAGEGLDWYRSGDDVEPGAALEELGGDDGDGLYSRSGSLYVGIDGREAVLSGEEDAARAWRSGDAATLAGDDDVTAVARAIDDAEAVSGTILGLGDSGDLIGVGWIDDGGDPAFVIVYGLGSDDAARAAEDGIADGFDELGGDVDVDDVTVDGSLVVVAGHQVDDVSAPIRLLQSLQLPVPD